MNIIIKSTINTLLKSKLLLSFLTDKQLSDETVSPYYSSIGSHIRHILDFYDCVLNAKHNSVDLTERKRNRNVEISCESAIYYLNDIINKLTEINFKKDELFLVNDDLGLGKVDISYTFSGLLAQANSHTIHHYAIISYILAGLNLSFDDETFGYNPTTPAKIKS